MRPEASLVRAFVIPACYGAGSDGGSVGEISHDSCTGYQGMSVVADAEVLFLLMRPQPPLVHAFVILACIFAGSNGTVGDISVSSCVGDQGVSIMVVAEMSPS